MLGTLTKRQQATRKQDRIAQLERNARFMLRLSSALLIISLSLWVWYKVHDSNFLPINNVSVDGNYQHINQQDLKHTLMPYVDNGFFAVDIAGLHDHLVSLPWVESVEIKRVWPDKLLIHITEQKPVARWNEVNLLNTQGEIFSPPQTTIPQNLPLLTGQNEQHTLVVENYKKMSEMLTALGLGVAELHLSPRLAWQLKLNNGITIILGREDVYQRLQRFIDVYSQIIGARSNDVSYVDMRYPNGMAVNWKQANSEVITESD